MASWQPTVTTIDSAGTSMFSSARSESAIRSRIRPAVGPYWKSASRIWPGDVPLLRQVVEIAADVREDLLGIEEAVVRAAGRERDRVRIAEGDLVEEVHRVQERVRTAGVQIFR